MLEERQRLSRELHDSVSQALYSIALSARTARALLERDPALAAEPLDFTLAQAERALAEMRAVIFELRPEVIEQEGLVATVRKGAEAIGVRHGLRVHAELCDEPDIPAAAKEALFRIMQEALHNVVKHAGAASVQVSLDCRDGDAVLEVQDDGRGFATDQAFPGHLGLTTMQERAARLGGTVDIKSALGEGACVRATLPVSPSS